MISLNTTCSSISNITVGFFTLTAALGTVWLKDYLDNKKVYKLTSRQKAIEAYALANKLIHSLNSKHVLCSNLLEGIDINYSEYEKNFPDVSLDILEKLELLIIENFYELKSQFEAINSIIVVQSQFLLNIIINIKNPGFNIDKSDFTTKQENFAIDIITACNRLRDGLINKYIYKENCSIKSAVIHRYKSVITFIKKFFC